jgi:hypothetical protein
MTDLHQDNHRFQVDIGRPAWFTINSEATYDWTATQ